MVIREFREDIRLEEASTHQIGSVAFPPVHNSILVIDYLTKMGIKTVPQPPDRPCSPWLLIIPKAQRLSLWDNWGDERGCKEVIDTLTQKGFHGAFQKMVERYNKCIAVGGHYFEGDKSFMSVLSIKVPIGKKSLETYLMILVYIQGGTIKSSP